MGRFFLSAWLAFFIVNVAFIPSASANNANTAENSSSKVERYTKYVYDKISFKKMQKLDYKVFQKAFIGYLNIKEAGKVHGNALLTVCDFSLSSNLKRMWVIDVARKKVLFNTLVAHGQGSGEEFANKFSNIHESHQSSLGFYTTGEIYNGDNGMSLKLHGIDGSFNSNAFDRGVVMHGSDYVSEAYAAANNRIGRSHGCPAIPRALTAPILNKINDGHVVFIYHPTKQYLKTSFWLNNRVANLPQEANFIELLKQDVVVPTWADKAARPADSLIKKRIVSKTKEKTSAETTATANPLTVQASEPNTTTTSSNTDVKLVQPQVKGSTGTKNITTSPAATKVSNTSTSTSPTANPATAPANTTREKDFLYIRY